MSRAKALRSLGSLYTNLSPLFLVLHKKEEDEGPALFFFTLPREDFFIFERARFCLIKSPQSSRTRCREWSRVTVHRL